MLVIESRGHLQRYNGYGMFNSIGRKMFSNGVKAATNKAARSVIVQKVANAIVNGATTATHKAANAISSGTNSLINQKIAEAVVNGATSAAEKAAEYAGKEAIDRIIPYAKDSVKKISGFKRSILPPPPSDIVDTILKKKSKLDLDQIINGSGIILD